VANEDLLSPIVDFNDQTVFVPTDIEHGESLDLVGLREVGPHTTEVDPMGSPRELEPSTKGPLDVRIALRKLPEFLSWRGSAELGGQSAAGIHRATKWHPVKHRALSKKRETRLTSAPAHSILHPPLLNILPSPNE
jgi:hypothetical protein